MTSDSDVGTARSSYQHMAGAPQASRCLTEAQISVVIPLYNGRHYIRDALASVEEQSLVPIECIVVDDGSTDGSADVVADWRGKVKIRMLSQPNAGQSAARNAGAGEAEGELLAFLDQDDIWYTGHLEALAREFQEVPPGPPVGWAYHDCDQVDEGGELVIRSMLAGRGLGKHPKRSVAECIAEDMFVLPSASLIARSAFQAVGGFDERLSGYEDDDLFLRIFRRGYDNRFVPQSLSQWRVFTSSSSYTWRMARSRRIYFEKLVAEFGERALEGRRYLRELIAPRFLRRAWADYVASVACNDGSDAPALEELLFYAESLPLEQRMAWRAGGVLLAAAASFPGARSLGIAALERWRRSRPSGSGRAL